MKKETDEQMSRKVNGAGSEMRSLKAVNRVLESKTPQAALRWAIDRFFPSLGLACSFGAEDVVLVDMITQIEPEVTIFYLDTDVLFEETYQTRDRLIECYGIEPVRYRPELSLDEQEALHGAALWASNPNRCCRLRKVEPLIRALEPLDAWMTGIRREQSPTRAKAPILSWDRRFELVKVNPLARWTTEQVWQYIEERDVPYNPLHDHGYPSIGCIHCTEPVNDEPPDTSPRSGRWQGRDKTECGLHG